MITVKFKKVHPQSKFPFKGSEFAGAFDVYATEIIKESDDCFLVKLGFALEFSPEYKVMFAPRSSVTKTKWNLQNSPGIGDADFRGEYSLRFRAFPENYGNKIREGFSSNVVGGKVNYLEAALFYPEFPYKVGDRVAQIYFQKIIQADWVEAEELSETKRGGGAYGSTGK